MRHTFPCHAARAALLPAFLGSCVSGPTSRPPAPLPPPSPATIQALGYSDVVQYGTELAHRQGYDVEFFEAVPVGRNLWRVRFGLGARGSGRLLEVEFDAASRRLVSTVELQEVARKVGPDRPAGTIADAGVQSGPGP